jgi:Secretion system C-terminal sorting domain
MKNLKLFPIFFLTFLFLTFKTSPLIASHATGAEFSYVYVGPNTYEITFTFYRDCAGITPTNPMDIDITNSCGYPSRTIFFPQLGIETDVATLCPGALTECHGGIMAGRQKWIYRSTVTLGGPCSEWQIGHVEPARNASVSTITGAGSDNLYTYSIINNLNGIVNSSPVFINDPVVIYNVNQRLSIDNSVYDPDGDSLVFEMIVPRTGPNLGDTVVFLPGYSYDRPFISSSPITIESNTGLIEGVPTMEESSIYAILINEYRNGILIGQIERDLNFLIQSTTNFIPDVAGLFGSSDFSIDVFANQQNCFQIPSFDVNANDQTTMDINCFIPGMSSYVAGTGRDTGFFCWTPTLADTIGNPHCFTVSVKDDFCAVFGYQARSYCINVQLPVDIDELNSHDISIYPNPFNSEIKIKLVYEGKSEMTIFDMQGRKIISKILDSSESVHDFQELENGMYVVSITALETNQIFYQRMMKVN